jgi:hypothetical protein
MKTGNDSPSFKEKLTSTIDEETDEQSEAPRSKATNKETIKTKQMISCLSIDIYIYLFSIELLPSAAFNNCLSKYAHLPTLT